MAFDGKMLHGVVKMGKGGFEDDNNCKAGGQSSKRRRKNRRRRLTLLINLWLEPPSKQNFAALPKGHDLGVGRGGPGNTGFEKAAWHEMSVSHPLLGKDNDDPNQIIEKVSGTVDPGTYLLVDTETSYEGFQLVCDATK